MNGYFEALLRFLDESVSESFVRPDHREMLVVADRADALIDRLENGASGPSPIGPKI